VYGLLLSALLKLSILWWLVVAVVVELAVVAEALVVLELQQA
jgi:hypothetical protein